MPTTTKAEGDPGDLVKMTHRDDKSNQVATTTVEAFNEVWSAKGWRVAGKDVVEEAAVADTATARAAEERKP